MNSVVRKYLTQRKFQLLPWHFSELQFISYTKFYFLIALCSGNNGSDNNISNNNSNGNNGSSNNSNGNMGSGNNGSGDHSSGGSGNGGRGRRADEIPSEDSRRYPVIPPGTPVDEDGNPIPPIPDLE